MGEWQARCLAPGRDVICDRGSTSPFISLDIQDRPAFGEALASWHEQHYRQDSSTMAGAPSKYVHPVIYHSRLIFSVFRDDQLGCSSTNYRLCGCMCILGIKPTLGTTDFSVYIMIYIAWGLRVPHPVMPHLCMGKKCNRISCVACETACCPLRCPAVLEARNPQTPSAASPNRWLGLTKPSRSNPA